MRPLPLLPLVLGRIPASFRRALEQEGIPCRDHESGPPAGRFLVFDSQTDPLQRIPAGQIGLDAHRLRAGLARDPFAWLDDRSTCVGRWSVGPIEAQETVAQVDRREVRAGLMERFRRMLEVAGGIWLKLAAFPHPFRSAFNFRLDHDAYVDADFQATLDALEGYEHVASHYVCAATHANHRRELRRLHGAHVGSHGWWHHTYVDCPENLRNIRRGIEWLADAGLPPIGFTAPHGRYNEGLARAMGNLGIDHSSEFSLGYDDLPWFPGDTNVLQIPIHPVCLGVVLEAVAGRSPSIAPEQAAGWTLSHFRQVAEAKRRAGESIFLYGHPDGRIGRYPNVLIGLLQTVAEYRDIWQTNLAQMAQWWRARMSVECEAHDVEGKLSLIVRRRSANWTVAAELWQGPRRAYIPLEHDGERVVDPANLSFELGPMPAGVAPRSVHSAPWGARLRRSLDWERVTPTHELSLRAWRGWAKRTLRYVKR